jgi:viologen exporter family transport system ATP-binding protein
MNESPLLQVQRLTRRFRTYRKEPGLRGALKGLFRRTYDLTTAVNEVSFSAQEGELVGFLGPNGAGKTTTLKMLAGLIHPSSGSASVLGYTPWKRPIEYRRQFALLLGQKNQLWWDLPARESLELNARIYRIPRKDFLRRLEELSEMLDVQDKLNIRVRELSLGERMKLEMIAALLHHPKVLFLDEPTIGLDVVSQNIVREFLRAYNQTYRTTILLTSHYMSDIEFLCRRVIIINEGTLFFDGPLEEVLERFADFKLVSVRFAGGKVLSGDDLSVFGEVLEQGAGHLKLKVGRDRLVPVCKALLEWLPVTDLDIQEVSAEQVIRRLFTSSARVRARSPADRSQGLRCAPAAA